MNWINRVLNRIGRWQLSHLSIYNTLVINLRCFDLRTALKFPIYIYSKTKIFSLGEIEIKGKISKGMIRIGHHPAKAIGPTKILGRGKYTFYGPASIWGGCILENYGHVILGTEFSMAESCILLCANKIEFGDKMSIGFKNTFMDSSFHFLLDTKRRMTVPITGQIKIGGGTWITSDCKIMQGACLPPNSVLITNSVLKSDYSEEPEGHMFGGNPAKIIRSGVRRIFDRNEERILDEYFKTHPEKPFLKVKYDNEDDYCLSNSFVYNP